MKIADSKYSMSRQINSRIEFSFSSILAEFCHMIHYEPTISRTMVSLITLPQLFTVSVSSSAAPWCCSTDPRSPDSRAPLAGPPLDPVWLSELPPPPSSHWLCTKYDKTFIIKQQQKLEKFSKLFFHYHQLYLLFFQNQVQGQWYCIDANHLI